ncbi:methyl-accepting chemotaxis protein [Dermatophilus congolensis]|uniref:methyl-accepting chemotaxis protein n=1 Tax=Dermatophilus congolensis TaxID=1863 RepID=UPI001AAECFCE|nr:methyl-accepting chemotaxis protein [Dermatophilus congolensis]MBO3128580.1 methyl-accepting chemotaxis protein [Dermatophilus congolensis]MBO3132783.1 methyl-accepting chemotaxis protein [Dermatophilus congolensis]MBO3133058.1 methyl-accepting chemotaxis protein [Dermatophilus congolensis]MBO3135290.1 methyl-accepting chemotaxis protein [Dermatophilus congolensis]MBO3137533.1 methyl-accepting chemotaxis protein [Dermatophilus congolensis]
MREQTKAKSRWTGIKAQIGVIGAVGIIGMILLGISALIAVGQQRSLSDEIEALRDVNRKVEAIRYANADVSGWQAFYVWDTRRKDPAEAVAGGEDTNRGSYLAATEDLKKQLAAFPVDQLSTQERAHWDAMTAAWKQFFDADARAVALYRTKTPANLDKADEIIDDSETPGTAAHAYDIIDNNGKALFTSVRARSAEKQKDVAKVATTMSWIFAVVLVLAIALLAFTVYRVSRRIFGNISAVLESVSALSRGDLTVPSMPTSQDELGRMALAIEDARLSMREVISEVTVASTAVSGSSSRLAQIAEEFGETSTAVAEGMQRVSQGTAGVSDQVQAVAAGAEEMTASIREIAKNAEAAAGVAGRAVAATEMTNRTIAKLGESSIQIDSVIKSIGTIANQTNQLALNATIESARAGEAGRGFAVVAGEVKDLARETSTATQDISRRITEIQEDTAAAVAAIEQISMIIRQIDDTQSTIASAVEEQTATTNEMGANIHRTANDTTGISRELAALVDRAGQSSTVALTAADSARELADEATTLNTLVSRFRL